MFKGKEPVEIKNKDELLKADESIMSHVVNDFLNETAAVMMGEEQKMMPTMKQVPPKEFTAETQQIEPENFEDKLNKPSISLMALHKAMYENKNTI